MLDSLRAAADVRWSRAFIGCRGLLWALETGRAVAVLSCRWKQGSSTMVSCCCCCCFLPLPFRSRQHWRSISRTGATGIVKRRHCAAQAIPYTVACPQKNLTSKLPMLHICSSTRSLKHACVSQALRSIVNASSTLPPCAEIIRRKTEHPVQPFVLTASTLMNHLYLIPLPNISVPFSIDDLRISKVLVLSIRQSAPEDRIAFSLH